MPCPRAATYAAFKDADGDAIDEGLALFFAAPHSYTGEDVLELQGHGAPVVLDLLLNLTLSKGVRLARPGEFTERAFLNERLDLAQAESVIDLINSASEQARDPPHGRSPVSFQRRLWPSTKRSRTEGLC
ncbi:MAG: hypothetical protein CM1200mP9_00250 [Gammaproteobacteria bacterium]|nr:MAG: hypothetical protein CM1200mP9_00250 [Gammaproteobacteria bacterium]